MGREVHEKLSKCWTQILTSLIFDSDATSQSSSNKPFKLKTESDQCVCVFVEKITLGFTVQLVCDTHTHTHYWLSLSCLSSGFNVDSTHTNKIRFILLDN